jgi:hypothetical protein
MLRTEAAMLKATPDAPVHAAQAEHSPVSFLVTSYNKASYLPSVLKSVAQEAERTGGEIILVDDGSTDGSDRICADFAGAHPEADYWRQDNRGIYATINLIAAKARGAWVRFCDSDDPLIPGSTECLIRAAEKTGAGVAYGKPLNYGPEPVRPEALARGVDFRNAPYRLHPDGLMHLIRGMNCTPSMSVYRRDALQYSLPLPESGLISCQDLALLFPAVSYRPLVAVDAPVCHYLTGAANQLSANAVLTLQQTIRITQRNSQFLAPAHKRAALLKAINRTRRMLKRHSPLKPERMAAQFWLLLAAARTKLGLSDFDATLDAVASLHERDLSALLRRSAKPF